MDEEVKETLQNHEVDEETRESVSSKPKEDSAKLLPEMTLYHLDLEKIISKGGEKFDAAKNYGKCGYGKLLCEHVIDIHNSRDNTDCDTSSSGERADNEETQQQDGARSSTAESIGLDNLDIDDPLYVKFKHDKDYTNALVVGYKQCKSTKNQLMEALSHLGFIEQGCKTQTVSVILFVIMGGEESPSIYALTKNYAHLIVRDICDDNFSFTIAKCNMDPNIKELGKRHLVGKSYASYVLYRQETIPIHMSGNDLVNSVKSRFKDESKIVKVNQSLQLNEKGARVNVTRKGVHICKQQSLEQFVNVIQHMENLLKNGREEEAEELAYLDYIKLIKDPDMKEKLEDKLVNMIWQDIKERLRFDKPQQEAHQMIEKSLYDSGIDSYNSLRTQTDQPGGWKPMGATKHGYIDFCYRDPEKYYNGHNFTFVRKKGESKEQLAMWSEPKSYEEVLEDLDTAFKDKRTLDSFSDAIKERKLKFTVEDKSNEEKDQLLNFFQAECKLDGQCYFKVNAEWLMVDLQYIYQVHKDFQNLLRHKLKDEKSEVQLPVRWSWNWYNKERFRESHVKDITKLEKKDVKEIWQWFEKMDLVTKTREVKRSELQKVMPSESTITHVDDFVSKMKGKRDQFNRDVTKPEFSTIANADGDIADTIWHQLDRCKIVKMGKVKPIELEKFIQQIKRIKQYLSMTDGMNEGTYNEIYSFLKSEENGLHRWYVGDRILQDQIEVFDIMQAAENRKDLYLYHVKESFGQKTRDACSQIKVSASVLRTAINSQSDDFLEKFYETIVRYDDKDDKDHEQYRIKEGAKVKSLGKEGFVELFKSRRITYVYAFVDTQKVEARLNKELNRKIENTKMGGDESTETENSRTDYDSNIARVELLALNHMLEGLGFQLAICQINRTDAANSKDQKPHVKQQIDVVTSPRKKIKLDN